MRKPRLSPEQAFAVMSVFLEKYHTRTGGGGEIGALLGDLQLNEEDGLPLDPAAWNDWLAAVDEVLATHNNQLVNVR